MTEERTFELGLRKGTDLSRQRKEEKAERSENARQELGKVDVTSGAGGAAQRGLEMSVWASLSSLPVIPSQFPLSTSC